MKKKKLFESIPIPRVKSESTRIVLKAQTEKEWLVLDLFQKKAYIGRYVLNTETGEHKSFIADKGKWCSQKLLRIMGFDPMYDELVEDSQKLEIVKRMNEDPKLRQQEAAKMEEKFSKASAIMREIKGKYEFTAEGYRIVMPESPVDIVREGYALHHCAGSSERYFNRIENRETFIGFLRRQQEPDIPFYTIEFEPGDTIRQNRSYYDEEPGIEEIRGFLKLWQKEIKSRLTKDDKEHATRSAALRKQNIKELQEKQNSFVLKKLEEDFMEAI